MYPKQWLRFPAILGTLFLSATLLGCEEANHDLADPPGPDVEVPIATDPALTEGDSLDTERADVNIDIDRENGPEVREDRREERRGRIREALDDVDVDVDGEQTDVQIGNGKIDVDAQ